MQLYINNKIYILQNNNSCKKQNVNIHNNIIVNNNIE